MLAVKIRNKPAEAYYFKCLRRWQEACKNLKDYEEHSLKFLFEQLETAWKKIGYEIGDP